MSDGRRLSFDLSANDDHLGDHPTRTTQRGTPTIGPGVIGSDNYCGEAAVAAAGARDAVQECPG